ncbi:MAG TPA: hypothetical protein VE907_00485 [Gammaproteobacteria bacterium]|nr:hypothetical protein [Gammaproteobacteria bacterium]
MTTSRDAYWDELGIAWRAIKPEIATLTPRLEARLRRQSLSITAALVVGLPLSAAGLLLCVFTIWSGLATGTWNFVTRGVAIGLMSSMAAIALSMLLPVRASDAAGVLSEMLDLAIARAQRALATIRLGYYVCAVAAVFGLVGAATRTYLTSPPQLSPAVDLAVLAVFVLGLFLCDRRVRVNLEKLRYLKRVLAVEG